MNPPAARTPLEILFSISRELSSTLDLHKIISRVLVLSTENIGAERASLVVLDRNSQPVDAAIFFEGVLTSGTVKQMRDVVESGLAGWVIRNKQPALIPNTSKDKRWLKKTGEDEYKDSPRSALCVPLAVQNQITGVLTIVHPKVNYFSEEQFRLQQAIGGVAAIAVRNAQLYEDTQTAHNRYHEVFENSIDPILIAEFGGMIVEANHQAVEATGFSNKELLSMQIKDLHEISAEHVNQSIASKKPHHGVNYESRLRTKSGEEIPVEVVVSHLKIQEREYLQWIFRDVSERKKLDRLREDLSAMIYHDLRSPLANIISSHELMAGLLPLEANPSLKSLYDISVRSTARMQRLISSLLDINRLESGQPITDKTAVDVEDLINEALETIHPITQHKELKLEKLIPSSIPPLLVDGEMIRRVIINLLENAAKFSPQKARISTGAKLNGDQITIWVEDHGPGIPAEARDRIFDKFVRLHGESMAKGLGLGLAFCRIAVQAHGGRIWVENVPEGGSRFMFTLPAALK